MKFSLSYSVLSETVSSLAALFRESGQPESVKQAIIFTSGGVLYFGGYTQTLNSVIKVAEGAEFEKPFQKAVMLKSLLDVVEAFRGTTLTEVDNIDFAFEAGSNPIALVYERVRDGVSFSADLKPTMFVLQALDAKAVHLKELEGLVESTGREFEQISAPMLSGVLSVIVPTVAGESREATRNVHFGEDNIYTVLPTYVAVIQNQLPNLFRNVRFSNFTLSYLSSILNGVETVGVIRDDAKSGLTSLLVQSGGILVQLLGVAGLGSFDVGTYVEDSNETGVVISRGYTLDILKRLALGGAEVYIQIDIDNSMIKFQSDRVEVDVPLTSKKRGRGKYILKLTQSIFKNMIFGHLPSDFSDDIYLYVTDVGSKSTIRMDVKDATGFWKTCSKGVTKQDKLPSF